MAVMHPFPELCDIEEIYVKDRSFSTPWVNPYQNSRMFKLLERLYEKYGRDSRFIARQCLRLDNAGEPKSVLDIGCSTGRVLKSFKDIDPGLELHGIDIDPGSLDNAISSVKDSITVGRFMNQKYDRKFNIITLTFVIEHLMDFKSIIQKAEALLKPGGVLFVSTPDIDSPKARQQKSDWRLINDPSIKIGHIHWFNKNAMKLLGGQFGLDIKSCVRRGELLYHLPIVVQDFLWKLLGRDPVGSRFIKYYFLRMLYAPFFDGVLSEIFGYGDCLYVFFQKRS